MLSKEVSSTIFYVFGMTRHGIELQSPGPLANTLTTRPMTCNDYETYCILFMVGFKASGVYEEYKFGKKCISIQQKRLLFTGFYLNKNIPFIENGTLYHIEVGGRLENNRSREILNNFHVQASLLIINYICFI